LYYDSNYLYGYNAFRYQNRLCCYVESLRKPHCLRWG